MKELSLFPEQESSPWHFEMLARRRGYRAVAGIDEAGRGPLAGPVVAAAVILPDKFALEGLTDSKKLSEKQRLDFYPRIREQALAVGVGVASVVDIDRFNILQATLQAMQRAIGRLALPADYLLVDGITPVPTSIAQRTLKQGDSRSLSIAAASVVAKVVRDHIMEAFDRAYPGYGFAAHKGYGSRSHLEAIARLRPCPQHRRSFRGVREHLESL
ncbi:RNase HII [Geoalkalibacter ferrihydriticus]|uniref:Ribonuclease HII n=2 Tax=Geoalkalibacter ferrihydriticus TaxID=392333 RepID=A0A0C2HLG9_9BACT|nr:ribonuclease HII [Geoalkalibacter ferrihydriticus]KIH77936.1 ribonuclease HII [Geoalkalibacter ferrihydriticus DSM 17813]SDM36428.1 RNase HII [Geoalkalibacter ferrihydriticus]